MKTLSAEKIEQLLKQKDLDPKLKADLKKKKEALSNDQIIRKDGNN